MSSVRQNRYALISAYAKRFGPPPLAMRQYASYGVVSPEPGAKADETWP